jgi:RNase adapter protein RapZ
MRTIIVTGLSGSGKSVVLKVLEDAGYYCVDNLPVMFVLDLISYLQKMGTSKVALSLDVRSGSGIGDLPKTIDQLIAQNIDPRVLFLEANTETIVKRFSEARRPHPLADDKRTLQECIAWERNILSTVAERAHHIDTSDLGPNALRAWVREFIDLDETKLTLFFQSFGFKNGIPRDADYVFDVRPLPNPYYDPKLRPLTGKDQAVIAFLESIPDVQEMLSDIERFIARWLPDFVRDNRRSLTIAIGCTGGQHRSVYFAEQLAAHFGKTQQVQVRHRGLYRDGEQAL